jgi:hypothetical protein
LSGVSVRFADEHNLPRTTTMSLLDLAGATSPAPVVAPAVFRPDDRPLSRIEPVVLYANVRADLLWSASPSSAALAATPEPSGLGVCLLGLGWGLLRRRRRAPKPTGPTPA